MVCICPPPARADRRALSLRDDWYTILAPHQAAFSIETGRKVSAACAQAIVDLMNGQRPKMVLNPEVFDSPQLRAKLN